MSDVTVSGLDPSVELRLHRLTGAFLAGYRNVNTRTAYLQQLHRWLAWCTARQLDPLEVEQTHVGLYLRWFERQVGSLNTVGHGLSVLASFYRRLVLDRPGRHHPDRCGPPPSRDETPSQTRLTRHELADWLNAAEHTVTIHGQGDKDVTIRSPRGPAPRLSKRSTAAPTGRCCATGGATV